MTYYVTFNEGSEKQAWDWMVVKETKDSSWQIRDWGQPNLTSKVHLSLIHI